MTFFNTSPALAAFNLIFVAAAANGQDWRHIRPQIQSEVIKLQQADAQAVLSEFCEGKVNQVPKIGLECSTRPLGPAFADLGDQTFHPEAIIYGHFLSATSEDAAVSGWNMEAHPALWRGTLMLTRKAGKWTPLWYKSSVITRACRKISMPAGREILLCEEEDGGMGWQYHYLYAVDALHPKDIRNAPLVVAGSFSDGCTVRKQVIQLVAWDAAQHQLLVTLGTPEWSYDRNARCDGMRLSDQDKRPPKTAIMMFALTDTGFRVAPRP